MFKEFREFALKGSFADLAVGLIVGAAVGKVVTSLVNDVIMAPLGALLGRVDFANLFVSLDPSGGSYRTLAAAKAAGIPYIAYGQFINTVIEFLLVMLVVFFIVKAMNKLRRTPEATTRPCPYCATDVPKVATRCPACTSEIAPV